MRQGGNLPSDLFLLASQPGRDKPGGPDSLARTTLSPPASHSRLSPLPHGVLHNQTYLAAVAVDQEHTWVIVSASWVPCLERGVCKDHLDAHLRRF